MTPDEIRKLLGGYATGTLTDTERNLLFSAALEDQELFDALADEEALRELLAEPATRQALMKELEREPALDAQSFRDRRAPLELRAQAAPPPPGAMRADGRSAGYFTPRRMAVAGGLAAILLVVAGLQYHRLRAPAAVGTSSLAMSRAPEPADSVPRPALAEVERDPRKVQAPTLDSSSNYIAQLDKNREKDSADAGRARDQLNQAVREQAAREQTIPAEPSVQPAPPLPITPGQIVAGGLSRSTVPPQPLARRATANADRLQPIDAKVTDVNGTIVSINMGSNRGLQAGDVIEILRENRVIATSKLSQVGPTFAVGPLQPAAGSSDTPRAGDAVRRSAASQPQQ